MLGAPSIDMGEGGGGGGRRRGHPNPSVVRGLEVILVEECRLEDRRWAAYHHVRTRVYPVIIHRILGEI